ncbi:hypothetical protein HK096_001471 [Nowakowskiella sp. JEL0078]|nr:hypothetical protein HK096_001471 [Nowakowskiella sp. JEL0078]
MAHRLNDKSEVEGRAIHQNEDAKASKNHTDNRGDESETRKRIRYPLETPKKKSKVASNEECPFLKEIAEDEKTSNIQEIILEIKGKDLSILQRRKLQHLAKLLGIPGNIKSNDIISRIQTMITSDDAEMDFKSNQNGESQFTAINTLNLPHFCCLCKNFFGETCFLTRAHLILINGERHIQRTMQSSILLRSIGIKADNLRPSQYEDNIVCDLCVQRNQEFTDQPKNLFQRARSETIKLKQ